MAGQRLADERQTDSPCGESLGMKSLFNEYWEGKEVWMKERKRGRKGGEGQREGEEGQKGGRGCLFRLRTKTPMAFIKAFFSCV